jgi:hypothetical protein
MSQMNDRMNHHLSDEELATVLAALRFWQRCASSKDSREWAIATDGETLDPLTDDEIDALCVRLNAGG